MIVQKIKIIISHCDNIPLKFFSFTVLVLQLIPVDLSIQNNSVRYMYTFLYLETKWNSCSIPCSSGLLGDIYCHAIQNNPFFCVSWQDQGFMTDIPPASEMRRRLNML